MTPYQQISRHLIRVYRASHYEDGYQRDIAVVTALGRSWGRDEYIAAHYDEAKDDPIVIVKSDKDPDGTTWVCIEGGTRLAAHMRLETDPWCHILNGGRYTSIAEQARLFRELNGRDSNNVRTRVPTKLLDDHRAGLVHGDPQCVGIQRALDASGMAAVPKASADGTSMSALRRVHAWGGDDLVAETLAVLTESWPEPTRERHHGQLVEGLAFVIAAWQDNGRYTRQRIVPKLRKVSPLKVQDLARQVSHRTSKGYNTYSVWAWAIRSVVNRRLDLPPRR